MNENNLLEIRNLKISFPYGNKEIQVVRGINLAIEKNEIVGILGESGSGKTVTATSMLGLTKIDGGNIDSGEIHYNGINILKLAEKELRNIRGHEISYIFQNPVETLNPFRKIGKQLEEVQRVHKEKVSKQNILKLLYDLGLENAEIIYEMYPSQLSGGQCQRISIGMSLIGKAKIIIADEPTSSIDASMQGVVLDLFSEVNQKYGVAMFIITHNFEIVKNLCNRVAVMYGGLVMEQGKILDVLKNPIHPYTKELINCSKSMSKSDKKLYTLEGKTLSPQEFRNECPFFSRCKNRTEKCKTGIPELNILENGREIRCINV